MELFSIRIQRTFQLVSTAQEWQNEEKEDNNQKGRKRMIQLF